MNIKEIKTQYLKKPKVFIYANQKNTVIKEIKMNQSIPEDSGY